MQFGWAGLGGFHAGCTIEFYKPVLLGDKISGEIYYDGFESPKHSSVAGEMIIDYFHTDYYNQHDDALARYSWHIIRFLRGQARKTGEYNRLQLPHPRNEEKLKEIEEKVLSEEIRGVTLRFWEDVREGDTIGPV